MTTLRQPDSLFLALIVLLCVFGIIIFSSASSVVSFQSLGDPNALLKKQAIALVLGLLLMVVTMRLDLRLLEKFATPLFVFSVALMLLPFVPGLGPELLGAKRWVVLGGFFFQPSELVKLTIVVFLGRWLTGLRIDRAEPRETLFPLLGILGTVVLILVLQPDLGTAIVIMAVSIILYFVVGAPVKHFAWIAAITAIGLALLIQVAPYRAARLTVFLNPSDDTQGSAYHINQSLLAIGSGGLFGRGLGHSIQKFNYLPEAEGDSIFAIAAEELGFFLSAGLIALYVAVVWRGVHLARRASDSYVKLVITGIVCWFGMQAFINIGALTSVLPLTGEPLPFISNGGSSLVISLVAAGILLNYSRTIRV